MWFLVESIWHGLEGAVGVGAGVLFLPSSSVWPVWQVGSLHGMLSRSCCCSKAKCVQQHSGMFLTCHQASPGAHNPSAFPFKPTPFDPTLPPRPLACSQPLLAAGEMELDGLPGAEWTPGQGGLSLRVCWTSLWQQQHRSIPIPD